MPGLEDELDDALTPIIQILSAAFQADIESHLVQAYIQGDKEMVYWGVTKAGIPITYEGPPMEQAVKWARDHCAKLVTKMDIETKKRLAQAVAEAIENKMGIPGLKKALNTEFASWMQATDKLGRPIVNRAQMIARTETCNALEQAFMDRSKEMGITGKEWVGFDPCEICAANEAEGIVPIDHVFSSGDSRPPAHPNCRCALAPARISEHE